MAVFRPFPITPAKSKPRQGTAEAVDVAARHLIYKFFEATDGQLAWHLLGSIGERPETVARAAKHGWLVVRQEPGVNGRRKALQSAMLTDEGRLVARKGLRD